MTAAPTSVTRVNPTGVVNRAQGSISGTYTAATTAYTGTTDGVAIASGVITISLGFVPTHFKVVNVTDRVTQEWFAGMNFGDFLETAANGTQTLETDNQVEVTVSDTGTAPVTVKPVATVTITAAGGAMTDNDTVVWVAEG
jgi:hypothetical protein